MKVFEINEAEWYMADNIYDAIKEALHVSGLSFHEGCDSGLGEVSDDEMNRLTFTDEGGNTCTFAERLAQEIARGPKTPRVFATTEF